MTRNPPGGPAASGQDRRARDAPRRGAQPGEGILYSLPDYHLSERGRAGGAQAVADWLARHDITYVVASPLERAQETAAPIARNHGLAVDVDEDLIESHNVFRASRSRRGRRPARPAQLVASAQPEKAVLGRALRGDRRPDAGRRRAGPDQGRRS